MKVKVTIYLKSGGDLDLIISDTTIGEQVRFYDYTLGGQKRFIIRSNDESTTVIPIDNIAAIDIREIPD